MNIDAIFENFFNNNIKNPIFEVSSLRPSVLKDIDKTFSFLKNDKSVKFKKQLEQQIKQFTGIQKVIVVIKKDYFNASVFPLYNKTLPFSLSFSKNLFAFRKDPEITKDLTKVNIVKNIDRVYIIIGKDLMNNFNPRELTAILLHEIGHVFEHTSNFKFLIFSFLKKLASFALIGSVLTSLTNPLLHILNVLLLICSRSLTFREHLSEHHADNYAIEYGYGDEIIRVLNKIRLDEEDIVKHRSFFIKILKSVTSLFMPSSHPATSKRMCSVIEEMKTDYKKLYPKLNNEISIILSDLKC